MDGQGRDLISDIFEAAPECPEDLSLSILAWRSHKELYLGKPVRPEERTKDISQLVVRLRSSQSRAEEQSVRSKALE